MSGTSLDGVDAAVLVTDGETIFEFGPSAFHEYTDEERDTLSAALGLWSGEEVERATEVIMRSHIALLGQFDDVEIVGFHGQTLAHAPDEGRTLQIGDGVALAEALGRDVVWDFRTADVEFGGQGAPLAPFYHFALAKYIEAKQPVAFLNLGGVGNLTYVDPSFDKPDAEGALLAFDTGPANAPINDAMQARLGKRYDESGNLAKQGDVSDDILGAFLAHPYFEKTPPKSLDRDAFADVLADVEALSDADAIATLTACAAMAVVTGVDHFPKPVTSVLVTGGGRHNQTLMEMLSVTLPCEVLAVEEVGLDGDMLEAQAFAHLAVRVARGLPTSCPSTTGVRASIGGGTVSRPMRKSIAEGGQDTA